MQLYAFNKSQQLCSANEAASQRDYFCTECHQVVRVRKGPKRTFHFYHLTQANHCILSRKSLVHIAIQEYFFKNLPEGEVFLEMAFPEIKRIADVVWVTNKLIFEIQCSFIEDSELLARNQDYRSLGYDVIWILHDKKYNKRRLSSAEAALQNSTHYYSNMNSLGKGFFYDQWSVINKALRQYPIDRTMVTFEEPLAVDHHVIDDASLFLKERLNWKWHFKGDLFYRFSKSPLERSLGQRPASPPTANRFKNFFFLIKTIYLQLLAYGLKKWTLKL